MANITLAVPEDLHRIIKAHREIRWSEIARQAMWDYAQKLELMDRMTKNSKLTEVDVKTLDVKIKKALARHYKEQA